MQAAQDNPGQHQKRLAGPAGPRPDGAAAPKQRRLQIAQKVAAGRQPGGSSESKAAHSTAKINVPVQGAGEGKKVVDGDGSVPGVLAEGMQDRATQGTGEKHALAQKHEIVYDDV